MRDKNTSAERDLLILIDEMQGGLWYEENHFTGLSSSRPGNEVGHIQAGSGETFGLWRDGGI